MSPSMENIDSQQLYCKQYDLQIDVSGMRLDSSNMDVDYKYEKIPRDGLRYLKSSKYEIPKTIHTYRVSEEDSKKVIDQLPQEVLNLEIPFVQYLEITPRDIDQTQTFPAHIDPHRHCSLNIYLEANGEQTHFFEKQGLELVEMARFTAAKEQVWVLNTSKLHSVTINTKKTRKVVTLSFSRITYQELVQVLDTQPQKIINV